jgi:uncharacterized protein (DUF58 family)
VKGSGLTFVENRPYVPGDDTRAINWPLTARVGEPIVKRFESSRELILWLLVDPSPSMFLGDPVSPMRWVMEVAGAAMATMNAGKDRLGLLIPGDGKAIPALRIAPKRGRVPGLHLLEAILERGPAIPTPEAWQQALGHWGEHGKGHRLWLLSNGAGLKGLATLIKPLTVRHRVVWIRPENHDLKHTPNWPDPGFPPTVEKQTWDILEDPVVRLGAWLKGGGG